jgi:hypothetical protein
VPGGFMDTNRKKEANVIGAALGSTWYSRSEFEKCNGGLVVLFKDPYNLEHIFLEIFETWEELVNFMMDYICNDEDEESIYSQWFIKDQFVWDLVPDNFFVNPTAEWVFESITNKEKK